jgi:hypothetical protein
VVTSPLRTAARQASDIAHELSHLRLKHELSEIREIGDVLFRTCRPDEEEQATTFGDTLLLPRPLLLAAARRGLGPQQIAEKYCDRRDGALPLQLNRSKESGPAGCREVGQFPTVGRSWAVQEWSDDSNRNRMTSLEGSWYRRSDQRLRRSAACPPVRE